MSREHTVTSASNFDSISLFSCDLSLCRRGLLLRVAEFGTKKLNLEFGGMMGLGVIKLSWEWDLGITSGEESIIRVVAGAGILERDGGVLEGRMGVLCGCRFGVLEFMVEGISNVGVLFVVG